jgi:aconitate hydratase
MGTYLRATNRAELAALADELRAELLTADPEVEAEPAKFYDQVIEIDLSTLEPHVVGPHTPDLARPISQLKRDVAEKGYPDRLTSVLIGSCTNSSYEDIGRAADVARQARANGLNMAATLMVSPGSEQIFETIRRDGQMAEFEQVGGIVLSNACGPCIGQWKRDGIPQGEPNSILTSFNRNFPARNDGNSGTLAFISSPEIVVALGVAGSLSFNPLTDALKRPDGSEVRLTPPTAIDELPTKGFIRARSGFVEPAADSDAVQVRIDPNSKRLQALERFKPFPGHDYQGLPLLLKARGKCTTDHISPAGPWLKFRGHLDNISDNMFLGAVNAFTGEAGRGLNQLTGARETFTKVARAYKAAGLPWVVVGDFNYGEGSSREHAAMSPRHLGGVAIITRSFARIHETNLKKQGMLPLTFVNADDYDKVRETDRIDLSGLTAIAPGSIVTAVLHHADGTTDEVPLKHTLSDEQIGWFMAGSALNLLSLEARARKD